MSSRTNYLETQWLKHITGHATYTAPADLYLALFTTVPAEDGTGTEVTGGSYARQVAAFDNPTGDVTENTSTITFTDMPDATVVGVGVMDASTAGNMLYYKEVSPGETFTSGESAIFAAGAVTITAD